MDLPVWLETEYSRLVAMLERDQLPHAQLIYGPLGVGRRWLAFRLADRLLGHAIDIQNPAVLSGERIDDEVLPTHPDFRVLQPEEKKKKPGEYKKTIGIDQVRELIDFLSLTSHQSGAKVVIVYPAQAMTEEAANCLLKTLEEPAAGSYLLLVAAALSRLPPTIVSRCHRVRVPLPDRQAAGNWLHGIDPAVDWQGVLELSTGAPLAALEWQRIDFPQLADKLERDILALQQQTETPSSVAKRWVKYEPEPCLRWLGNRLSAEIRMQIDGRDREPGAEPVKSRLQKLGGTLNMEPSFAVLRQIGELRRLQGAGLNAELHLTAVLTRWYGGV